MSDVLKAGDRGTGVQSVQRYFASFGFQLAVDGQFGPETRAVVAAFQRQRGIRVDGIVGAQTMVEIAKASGEGWRTSTPVVSTETSTPATTAPPSMPKLPGLTPSMTPLLLIVGAALVLWYFSGSGKSKRSASPALHEADLGDDGDEEEEDEAE